MRSGLITVLRTVRFDRGSHGFLLFSHGAVLEAKQTVNMNGSRFFRSDRMVRSGFRNLAWAPKFLKKIKEFFFFFGIILNNLKFFKRIVHAGNEANRLNLTWAHKLFIRWA